jgi:predicted protein tyrosine phosphatase
MPFIQNCAASDIDTGKFYNDPGDNSILISIADPGGWRPTAKNAFKEQHNFEFLDIEKDDKVFDEECRVSDADATELVRILVYALNSNMNVIVHCTAGICRSGAVTEIGVQLGFDDTLRYRQPNLLVKHKMQKVLGWAYSEHEQSTPINLKSQSEESI